MVLLSRAPVHGKEIFFQAYHQHKARAKNAHAILSSLSIEFSSQIYLLVSKIWVIFSKIFDIKV